MDIETIYLKNLLKCNKRIILAKYSLHSQVVCSFDPRVEDRLVREYTEEGFRLTPLDYNRNKVPIVVVPTEPTYRPDYIIHFDKPLFRKGPKK